jgi:hypothetical protein
MALLEVGILPFYPVDPVFFVMVCINLKVCIYVNGGGAWQKK